METESIACTNCLHENDDFRDFCEKCGAPISAYAAFTPMGRIQTEGFAYRQATSQPNKPIVVFGMYLTFLPLAIGSLVMVAESFASKDYLWMAIFVAVEALSIAMLYKTTSNFVANKEQADEGGSL